MPPSLSETLFDRETCPGPSLACFFDWPPVDPFLESVGVIALNHTDSESHFFTPTFPVETVTANMTFSGRQGSSYETNLE
jgi:hypothetical protein